MSTMIGWERKDNFSKHCLTLTERENKDKNDFHVGKQTEPAQPLLLASVVHQGSPVPN